MNLPKTSSMVSVGVTTAIGSGFGYMLTHLADLGLPAWAAWFLGAGLTAAVAVVHLYQDPSPNQPAPPT